MKRRKQSRRMMIEDCLFLYSSEIQEQIRQSEEDINAGRYVKFKASEIDKLIEWLHEGEDINGNRRKG